MLLLPLPIIHRVLTKYQFNRQNQENESQSEITEFLFKYLEKQATKASSGQIYSQFINSSLLNTLNKIENEFVQIKQTIDTKKNETSKIAEEMKNFEQFRKSLRMQKDELKREIDQMKSDMKKISEEMKSDMKNNIDQIKAQITNDFTNDQIKLKDEISQLINNVKNELNQFKSEKSDNFNRFNGNLSQFKSEKSDNFNMYSRGLNQFKSENSDHFNMNNDCLNQHKSNSNKNFYKNKEENEELKKQIDHLKRIFFDIESSSYFEKSDNLDTFNSLYGESQALILEGIMSKEGLRHSQCITNVNDLLSYLLNERKKSNKPQKLTTFIRFNHMTIKRDF